MSQFVLVVFLLNEYSPCIHVYSGALFKLTLGLGSTIVHVPWGTWELSSNCTLGPKKDSCRIRHVRIWNRVSNIGRKKERRSGDDRQQGVAYVACGRSCHSHRLGLLPVLQYLYAQFTGYIRHYVKCCTRYSRVVCHSGGHRYHVRTYLAVHFVTYYSLQYSILPLLLVFNTTV